MIPVLSGRNIILELSLKVDEKKTSFFFFEEAEGRREKKTCFLRRPKVESSKVRLWPREDWYHTTLLKFTSVHLNLNM